MRNVAEETGAREMVIDKDSWAKFADTIEANIKSKDAKLLYLNRTAGGFPFELTLNIRVSGRDINDAADSVAEYIKDHADEILIPLLEDKE